jgi:hypothetical protein
MSVEFSKNYHAPFGGGILIRQEQPIDKPPSFLFRVMKKIFIWTGILAFIAIFFTIGFATILYPAYAMGLLLAPSVSMFSMNTKILIVVGIPLFWTILGIFGYIYNRK